ncbi:MAG TPA: hypothetical protein DD451_00005, partial [Candidatus Moranbacteria bacterium]|nr:hypothetical protein [Candidatus Moranbacteria bacterium]
MTDNIKTKILIFLFPIILLAGMFFVYQISLAAAEKQLEISGYISNNEGNEIDNGEYSIKFSIYADENSSVSVWSEVQTTQIVNGIFNASLGLENSLPNNLNFADKEYYLGIKIGEDSEMKPRKKMGAVPLALNAVDAMYLDGATIGTGEGDILQLGKNGKIDNDYLSTGDGDNDLVLGDDDRLHDQNTDTETDSETFNIGSDTSLSGNNFDLSVSSATVKPSLRYNGTSGAWQFSNDGVTFQDFSSDEVSNISSGGTGLSSIALGSLLFSEQENILSEFQGLATDDGEYLTFNWNGGNPTLSWEIAAGSFTSFDIVGDSGDNQTISNGNTLNIVGGTNIATVGSATDTLTINLDSTLTGTTWHGNTITAAYGGTGLISYVVGDLIYASGATTLARLPIGSNGQIMGVVGGVPTWQNSPFVGAHNLLSLSHPDTTAASPLSGDLVTGVDAGGGTIKWQRMAVGSAGQFLSNNGTSLNWNDTTNITELGTITTGTWNADILADAYLANDLTISGGSISTSNITLIQSLAPTPIVEGRIEWDTDNDRIVVGTGSGQATFYSGAGAGGISGSGTIGYVAFWDGAASLTSEQYLSVARGGTGIGTFGGVNTILYTTAADTLASVTAGTGGQVL